MSEMNGWTCAKCFEWNEGDDLVCTACGHVVPRTPTKESGTVQPSREQS